MQFQSVDECIAKNYNKLVRVANRLINDNNKASDIVHDAYIRVRKKEQDGSFKSEYPLTYIIKTINTIYTDSLRPVKKSVIKNSIHIEDIQGFDIEDFNNNSNKQTIDDKYFLECINYLEVNLSPFHASVFKFRYLCNYTIIEMSDMSGYPVHIIRKSLHKSRQAIKVNFGQKFYENLE